MVLGRVAAVVAAVLLVIGAAAFVLFRFTFSAERLHRVQVAVGIDAPRPERHTVPEGFRGWAVIHYGVTGAPPLPRDGETLVVDYPASGRLETSTPADDGEGFLNRQYFEHRGDQTVPLSRFGEVWGEYNMRLARDEDGTLVSRSAGFFVGTPAEYRDAGRPQSSFAFPEPGAAR